MTNKDKEKMFLDLNTETIGEDLEEAAEKYANTTHFDWPNQVPAGKQGFIAGAKWKELQMLEERVGWNPDFLKDIDEAEKPWIEAELWAEEHKDKVSNLNSAKFGYAYGYHARDKQLKEAIEGQIYGSDGSHWVESNIEESIVGKEGDKVKLIILKDKDNG